MVETATLWRWPADLSEAWRGAIFVSYAGVYSISRCGYPVTGHMSRRDRAAARCLFCQMHATLCICDLVPRLATRTRLTLLIHYREARKPTNTGLLAARCLAGSEVRIVGARDAQPELRPLHGPKEKVLLLYPGDDAVPIGQYVGSPVPLVLVVPDGNWRQAGKMRRRIAGLADAACVTLPDMGATSYHLRAEPRAGGLATLEAIARALRILEGDRGPAIEAALLAVFRVMVDRTLWLRGALPDSDVTGGIPAAAAERDPRGTGDSEVEARAQSGFDIEPGAGHDVKGRGKFDE